MPIVISGTNGISGVDGTASNPSYEGTDANTGVFFPAADTVAIGTNGTEALRVTSSQNVGIGTSSPGYTNAGRVVLQVNGSTDSLIGLAYGGTNAAYLFATSTATTLWSEGSRNLQIGTASAGSILFSTNNTERARFNASAPVLCLSGGNTSATGTGIAFPATQSASSDANTLDDYEEGTWTPQLRFGGASVGMTGTFSGRYTKVGNVVTIVVYVAVTNKGSSTGAAALANLPFNPATTGLQAYATSFVYVQSGGIAPGAGNIVSPNLNAVNAAIDMNKYTIATGADAGMTNGDFASAGAFWFNATYIAA
jgi:hypothetical protein